MNDAIKSSDRPPGKGLLSIATNPTLGDQALSSDKHISVDGAIEMLSKRLSGSIYSVDKDIANITPTIFFRCIFTGALSLFPKYCHSVIKCNQTINCRDKYEDYLNKRRYSKKFRYYLLGTLNQNCEYETSNTLDYFNDYGNFKKYSKFWKFNLNEHNDLLSIIKSHEHFDDDSKFINIKVQPRLRNEYSLEFMFHYRSNIKFVYCYDEIYDINYFLIDKNFEPMAREIFPADDSFYKYIESCFLAYLLFVDGIIIQNDEHDEIFSNYDILRCYHDTFNSIAKKIRCLFNELSSSYVLDKNEIENFDIEEQVSNSLQSINNFYSDIIKNKNSNTNHNTVINDKKKSNYININAQINIFYTCFNILNIKNDITYENNIADTDTNIDKSFNVNDGSSINDGGKKKENKLEKIYKSWRNADEKIFDTKEKEKFRETIEQLYLKINDSTQEIIVHNLWEVECCNKSRRACYMYVVRKINKFARVNKLLELKKQRSE